MADDAALKMPPLEYISEDELNTYEGWLKYQGIDVSTLTEEGAAGVREMFDDAVKARSTTQKIGRMKLKRPGDTTYAVAIRDGSDLWLAMWVKRSRKGEYFIFHPTADGEWNPHSSLHENGAFHMKSHDKKMIVVQKQRPGSIKGTEHLGTYMGFGSKTAGAVCDPADFDGVFEAPPGVLGPRNGQVNIDLIEPGSDAKPLSHPADEVERHLFTDGPTHVLIRIFRS